MSNEELAQRIKHGENELCIVLWENVKAFYYNQAYQIYIQNLELCAAAGVELSDIEQSMYFAFLSTITGYKEDSKYKFLTYAKYPIKTQMAELLGYRTSRREPLNDWKSLDVPLSDESDTTLLETIEDDLNDIETVENKIFNEQLHNTLECALAEYDTISAAVTKLHFYENATFKDIINRLGLNESNHYSQKRVADTLRFLRGKSQYKEQLKAMHEELESSNIRVIRETRAYRNTGLQSYKNKGGSSVELTAETIDEYLNFIRPKIL